MLTGNKRKVSLAGADCYPTPPWAVRALLSQETFQGTIHEPCCGNGAMSDVLKTTGLKIISSDLYDYGYGISNIDAVKLTGPIDNICTNPPYNSAIPMLTHFLSIYRKKIALLLRLAFLESRVRYPVFQKTPPSRVYVFPERLSLCPAGQIVKGGGTISYGWFIWDFNCVDETVLRWLPLGFKNNKN